MPDYVDALVLGGGLARWSEPVGAAAALNYRFLDALPANYAGAPESIGFAPLTAAQQVAAVAALGLWSEVANLSFSATTGEAQLQFGSFSDRFTGAGAWAYLPLPENGERSGDIWINNAYLTSRQVNPDQYGFFTLLHEIGHALGLKHPGAYDAGGGEIPPGPFLEAARDSEQFSVMSYHEHSAMWVHASTPMLFDIAAIQFLYGAKTSTRSGDSVYSRNELGEVFLATLWDGGGADTIDASGYAQRALIDLRSGEYSSIGPSGAGSEATNNLAIAYGVTIENARGGPGNDRITGNDIANRLEGGAGADVISGAAGEDQILGDAGDDQLSGGAGADTYLFAAGFGRDLVQDDTSAGDTVRFLATGASGIAQSRQGTDLVLTVGADQATLRDYYVTVEGTETRGWSFKTQDLDLPVDAGPASADPGEDRDSGRGLGIIATYSATEALSTDDPSDFYRFTVQALSRVALRISPTGGNADLELQREDGTRIAVSQSLTAPDLIVRELQPGTYYARAFRVSGAPAYELSASAQLTGTPNATDDLRDGANDLELLNHIERVATDWVNARLDPKDLYRFTLASIATLSVRVDGLAANADLRLLDANGATLQASARLGTVEETIVRDLPDGTYFLQINAVAPAETNYRLTASATTISVDLGPNSRLLLTTAEPVVVDSRPRIFSDWVVGSADANDFYKFKLNAASQFSLTLDQLLADANVQLQRTDGAVLYTGARTGTAAETLANRALIPGDYFVRVYPGVPGAKTSYRLTMSAQAIVDRAGNDAAPARLGTADARARRIQDSLGAFDRIDRIQFNVTGTSRISVAGQAVGATAQIRDSLNRVVANLKTRVTQGAPSIEVDGIELPLLGTLALAQGTYFMVLTAPGTSELEYALSLVAQPVSSYADSGNTRALAVDLDELDREERELPDRWVSGRLQPGGTRLDAEDFYKFTLTAVSNFALDLDGHTANADARLYNSVGVLLASSLRPGIEAERLRIALAAGEYYVRVSAVDVAETNYRLRLSAPPVSAFADAGNTSAQALQLDSLDNRHLVLAGRWVSVRLDGNDFYRFTLGAPSAFTASLSELAANADLQLLTGAGVLIASSANLGAATESLSRSLASGTYLVRVSAAAGAETNYRLVLDGTTIAPDSAGDSREQARSLNAIDARSLAFNDRVIGRLDANDFYRFTLNAAISSVTLQLSGLTANADLQLLDVAGRIVASSALLGTASEQIARTLPAGDYFTRVSAQGNADTTYRLNIAAATVSEADRAGNTREAAREIGVVDRLRRFDEWVSGTFDANDYYRFTLDWATDVTVGLSRLSANADVYILNSTGAVVASGRKLGAEDESLRVTLAAGTYFARVAPVGTAETRYELSLDGELSDGGDNTFDTARSIESRLGADAITDRVGPTDPTDFYRITRTGTQRLFFTLGGVTRDVDIRFYDANRLPIGSFKQSGTEPESEGFVVGARTVYMQVYEVAGETPYTISVFTEAATDISPSFQPYLLPTLGTTPVVIRDQLGNYDNNDEFRFTLAAPALFSATISGSVFGASLGDEAGNFFGGGPPSTAERRVMVVVDAGTYTLQLFNPSVPASDYTLSVVALALPADIDGSAGSLFQQYHVWVNLFSGGTRNFQDRIGGSGDYADSYLFTINPAQFPLGANVTIAVTGATTDVELDIYQVIPGATQTIATANVIAGPGDEILTRTLAPGQYQFAVRIPFNAVPSGESPYTVSVSAASLGTDPAGPTRGQAQDLGTLTTTPRVVQNWLSPKNKNDFFRFSVAQAGPIAISMSATSDNRNLFLQDIDLWLYDSEGRLLSVAKNAGEQDSDRFQRFLQPGTYFVEAFFAQNESITRYQLSFVLPTVTGGDDNTLATARQLAAPSATAQEITGNVNSLDNVDIYTFTLGSPATVTAALTGLTGDADIALLDASGDLVDPLSFSDTPGLVDESVVRLLDPGTYFVVVTPFEGPADYRLRLSGALLGGDGAGNAPDSARTFSGPSTFTDQVSQADDADFYRSTLTEARPVSIALTGLTGNANLWLLNEAGSLIAASDNAGTANESISRVLQPGTYFAEVWWAGGVPADYTITFAPLEVPPDGAGNSLEEARALGALGATTVTITEQIGELDTLDVYSFTLDATRSLSVRLSGLAGGADADLSLLDANGAFLDFSTTDGPADESISRVLTAGTYYVAVAQFSGTSGYALNLSAQGAPQDGAGNTPAAARVVPTLVEAPQSFSDAVSFLDDSDLYRFTLDGARRVTLRLDSLTEDADLELLDANGTAFAVSSESGLAEEQLVRLLAPGTYFAEVRFYAAEAAYRLNLSAIGVGTDNDPAGNDEARALDVTTLPFSTAGQVVAETDDHDFYRFTLAQPGRATVTLTGLNADADLRLTSAAAGFTPIESQNYGNESESIVETLAAGIYFVDVLRYSGDTSYNLAIAAETAVGDTAGNTTLAARTVTAAALAAGIAIPERVSRVDKDDYYSFTTSSRSSFSLALVMTGLVPQDADVELLREDGNRVALSANFGAETERLGAILDPGRYYVHVYPFEEAETDYTLALSAGALPGGFSAAPASASAGLAGPRANETFQAIPGVWSGVYQGGAGNDTYVAAPDAILALADGGSGEDTVEASGIGLNRDTSYFAEVAGRHLLLWDTASRQGVVLLDWQEEANRIETFRLSGGAASFDRFAEALAASGRYLRGLEWESLALSEDMRSWSLAGTSLFSIQRTQMQAMIAASGG